MTQPPYGSSYPSQPEQPRQPYQPQPPYQAGQGQQSYPTQDTQPTQTYPTQGYPTASYPTQPGYGAYQQGATVPPTPHQQPWGTPPPPAKKPFPMIPFVIGWVVLVPVIALILIFVVFREDDPTPPPVVPPTSQSTSDTPTESVTSDAPSDTASATTDPAVAAELGLVQLNEVITDEFMSVTTTVVQAGTTWIPALPQWGDPEMDDMYTNMIGVQITSDFSHSEYMGQAPGGGNFEVIGADGTTTVGCTDVLSSEEYASYSDAIIAAISGDPNAVAVSDDYTTGATAGWFVCFASEWQMPAFTTPGYTLQFTRYGGTDSESGEVIDDFVHTITVTP